MLRKRLPSELHYTAQCFLVSRDIKILEKKLLLNQWYVEYYHWLVLMFWILINCKVESTHHCQVFNRALKSCNFLSQIWTCTDITLQLSKSIFKVSSSVAVPLAYPFYTQCSWGQKALLQNPSTWHSAWQRKQSVGVHGTKWLKFLRGNIIWQVHFFTL